MKKYCCLILCFCIPLLSHGQLTTSSANTVNFLIQNVLVGSPSVYVSNITYNGAPTARGTFNCAGACNVGISSGVLLTTGSVNAAIGPNNATGAGQGNNTPGDPDLLGLAPNSNNPIDAAVLKFDFMVHAGLFHQVQFILISWFRPKKSFKFNSSFFLFIYLF